METAELDIGIASEDDLDGILALQATNHESNGGSLSNLFSRSKFMSIMAEMPMIVARRHHQVVGFLMSSSVEMNRDVPIVMTMLAAYPGRSLDAYIYGPICVDVTERKKGVARQLYAELKRLVPGREGILFIRKDNEASINAHKKLGMRTVSEFIFDKAEHLVISYIG